MPAAVFRGAWKTRFLRPREEIGYRRKPEVPLRDERANRERHLTEPLPPSGGEVVVERHLLAEIVTRYHRQMGIEVPTEMPDRIVEDLAFDLYPDVVYRPLLYGPHLPLDRPLSEDPISERIPE